MAGTRILRQDDFTGGLNLRADQFQLAPNESPRMLNVEIDPRGGVFSRGAMRRINTTPVDPTWNPKVLFPFYGESSYLMLGTAPVGATNGGVFYSTGSNFTNLSIPVTSVYGPTFAPWGKNLYITSGALTQSTKWDGTTKTTLTANGPVWQDSYTAPTGGYMPSANMAVTHAGKVFVAGTRESGVSFPNRIRWSHPNSPENWAAADYIDIFDGGERITAMVVFAGHLVVFKRNAVFAIFGYDSDTFQVVEISRTVGAATPQAVTVTERGVYFFSYPDGLMYYGGERIVDLFEQIRPAISLGFVNSVAVDSVRVNSVNRRVWVSLPYSETAVVTDPTVSFVYDPSVSQRGAWLMFQTADQKGHAAGCTFIKSDGGRQHVVAHPTLAYVLAVDLYNYAMDNITGTDYQYVSRYRSRWMDAGSYSQKKMFRRPDFVVKQQNTQGSMMVKVYGDYEEADNGQIREYSVTIPAASTGLTWGQGLWGANWGAPNAGSQVLNGRSIGLARSVQLEFVGSAGNVWGINSYTLKYNPRKVKA